MLKNKIKKKILILGGGGRVSPNVRKLEVSGVKGTAKTNKDLGMSCYIQVEYSGSTFFNHVKKNLQKYF